MKIARCLNAEQGKEYIRNPLVGISDFNTPSKLVTTVVSTFTAYYIHLWPSYFPDAPITLPMPSFDGRSVAYPKIGILRDYLSWRQVDCHINNLYNTTFWTLVLKGGLKERDAEETLKGTTAADKNEILFSRFGVNYNREDEMFKKGSVIYQDMRETGKEGKKRRKAGIAIEHVDVIKDDFWGERPWILSGRWGNLKT